MRRSLLTAGRLYHVFPLNYLLTKLGSPEFNQYYTASLPWPCYTHLNHSLHSLGCSGRPLSHSPHTATVTVRRTLLPLN